MTFFSRIFLFLFQGSESFLYTDQSCTKKIPNSNLISLNGKTVFVKTESARPARTQPITGSACKFINIIQGSATGTLLLENPVDSALATHFENEMLKTIFGSGGKYKLFEDKDKKKAVNRLNPSSHEGKTLYL